MRGSYQSFVIRKSWEAHDQRMRQNPEERRKCSCLNCKALNSEERELNRARALNLSKKFAQETLPCDIKEP